MPVATRLISAEEKIEALRGSNALRHRLRGLLQAQILMPRSLGRTGKIEPKALRRIGIGNSRIFTRKNIAAGMETAIHILLDRSYSMQGERLRVARQAGYAVAKSLWGVKGVSLAVSAFPGSAYENSGDTILPIVGYGERPGDNFGIEECGSTPLTSALWHLIQSLYARQEARKIILIMTDGAPDNLITAREAIARARSLGMEVYALGVCTDIVDVLAGRHGRQVWKLEDVPASLFALLRSTLAGNGYNACSDR